MLVIGVDVVWVGVFVDDCVGGVGWVMGCLGIGVWDVGMWDGGMMMVVVGLFLLVGRVCMVLVNLRFSGVVGVVGGGGVICGGVVLVGGMVVWLLMILC